MFPEIEATLIETPFMLIDSDRELVQLVGRDMAAREMLAAEDGSVFTSAIIMDLSRALVRFAAIVGTHDRKFTLREIATIVVIDYDRIDQWIREGVIRGEGLGRGKQREFTWSDAFVAGVCGSLRRQGVSLPMLRRVASLLAAELAPIAAVAG